MLDRPNKTDAFDKALETFLDGCKKIHANYVRANFDRIADSEIAKEWRVDHGMVRARIVHAGSAYCFVDYATGDVLKCAGYKAPAKHARGNIFSDKDGLEALDSQGFIKYLR